MKGLRTTLYGFFYQLARYVLIAVIFFLGVESFLWIAGLSKPVNLLSRMDYEGRSYFTTNPEYAKRFFQRTDVPAPQPLWIRQDKAPDTKRVIMLGESAAAGFPMMGYNLARLVQVIWDERFPDQSVEVINLSVVAVNSHVLRLFAREAMALDPDMIVLYAGHNEVIGPFGPASKFGQFKGVGSMARLIDVVRNTRTGRAVDSLAQWISNRMMDWDDRIWKGLDEFQEVSIAYGDPVLNGMLHHTEEKFRDIIERALSREASVLVCIPAVNLNDWPPLDSESSAYGVQDVLKAQETGDLTAFRSALTVYKAAQAREAQSDMNRAWPLYRLACDLDLKRIRADSSIRELQRRLITDYPKNVGMVDADRWLHEENPVFKGDGEYFLEHVHLTFAGRVAVAACIVDGMATMWGLQYPDDPGMDPETWWYRFPQLYAMARERTLFTPHDEAEIWRRTGDLLAMGIFVNASGITERKRTIAERVMHLGERAREDWDLARLAEVYDRAAEKNPGDALLHFTAGRLFGTMKDYERGRKAFERGLSLQPNHDIARLNLARLELLSGDTQRARKVLSEFDHFDQNMSGRALVEASISLHEGMTNQAIRDLRRHLDVTPRDIPVWEQLILLQEQSGDLEGAARSRARVRELRRE